MVMGLGKRAECEVIVTGEEDVVEYSYDTEYAKYLFDEVNKMRTAHGIEPFVWNEEDAVYASKVKVGMHVQPDPLVLAHHKMQILFSNDFVHTRTDCPQTRMEPYIEKQFLHMIRQLG